MSDIEARGYAHPGVLVSADWVADHLNDSGVRIVESNEDPLLYASKHIPGAVEVDWTRDLNDPVQRDYLDRPDFESLMSRLGLSAMSGRHDALRQCKRGVAIVIFPVIL